MPNTLIRILPLVMAALFALMAAVPASAATNAQCAIQWNQAKKSTSRTVLQNFLKACGASPYAGPAKARLAQIQPQTPSRPVTAKPVVAKPLPPKPKAKAPNCEQQWQAIRNTKSVAVLERFSNDCYNSARWGDAQDRIDMLQPPPVIQTVYQPPVNQQTLTASQIKTKGDDSYAGKRYNEALGFYNTACNMGEANACLWISYIHEFSQFGAQDFSKSRSAALRACDLGSPQGCNDYGSTFSKSEYGATDYGRATSQYLRSCTMGFAKGCDNARVMYGNAGYGLLDMTRAREYFDRAYTIDPGLKPLCTDAKGKDCSDLAVFYDSASGDSAKVAKQLALDKAGCEAGSIESCGRAADMLAGLRGNNNPDLFESRRFDQLGCDLGGSASCFSLWGSLGNSSYGPVDAARAKVALQRACSLGHQEACTKLQ